MHSYLHTLFFYNELREFISLLFMLCKIGISNNGIFIEPLQNLLGMDTSLYNLHPKMNQYFKESILAAGRRLRQLK